MPTPTTEFKDLPKDVTRAIEKELKNKTHKDIFDPTDPRTMSAYRSAIKAQLLPRPAITSLQKAFMDVDLAKDALLKTCVSHVSEFDPKSQGHPMIGGVVPRMKRKMDEVESLLKTMHTDLHDTITFYYVMTKATPQERGEYVIAQLDKRWDGKSLQELTKAKFDALCKKRFDRLNEYIRAQGETDNRTFVNEYDRIRGYARAEFHDMIAGFGAVAMNDELIAKLETIFERYIIITQSEWTSLSSSQRDRIKREVASMNVTLQRSQTMSSKGGRKRNPVLKK